MAEPRAFDRYASLYDLVYSAKDAQAEVAFVLEQLQMCGLRPGSALLELGAGTGRHARQIVSSDYTVVGVENSLEMIRMADTVPGYTLVAGDARSVRLDHSFDAVIALFHVLSYQTLERDVQSFFATASAHLGPGGLFGFDVWYSPAVHAIGPGSRTLQRENDSVSLVRQARPEEDLARSLVTVNYDFIISDKATGHQDRFSERHAMRHFTENEIAKNASESGFEVVSASEFLTGNAPSRDSWGVWFNLRKL